MRAAWKGHTDIAKALIANGASLNLRDVAGNTALICAPKGPQRNRQAARASGNANAGTPATCPGDRSPSGRKSHSILITAI
jgi:hypothetical protein